MQHRCFDPGDRALDLTTTALAAAQSRDMEAARLAIAHCYRSFQRGELPYEDYITLADVIMRTDLFASTYFS